MITSPSAHRSSGVSLHVEMAPPAHALARSLSEQDAPPLSEESVLAAMHDAINIARTARDERQLAVVPGRLDYHSAARLIERTGAVPSLDIQQLLYWSRIRMRPVLEVRALAKRRLALLEYEGMSRPHDASAFERGPPQASDREWRCPSLARVLRRAGRRFMRDLQPSARLLQRSTDHDAAMEVHDSMISGSHGEVYHGSVVTSKGVPPGAFRGGRLTHEAGSGARAGTAPGSARGVARDGRRGPRYDRGDGDGDEDDAQSCSLDEPEAAADEVEIDDGSRFNEAMEEVIDDEQHKHGPSHATPAPSVIDGTMAGLTSILHEGSPGAMASGLRPGINDIPSDGTKKTTFVSREDAIEVSRILLERGEHLPALQPPRMGL